MSEDNMIDLGSSSSAASSCSPSDVKYGSVEVAPQELHFFNSFEQEQNVMKHNIAIMNTTPSPVIVTVLCSHPSLVHALKLDNVRVEPHSKVQSRVVQHPHCRLPRLALLQIVTWTLQHKKIVSRHYLPIYINCRPSRETFENIRQLKTKLSKCLKNAVIVSTEDSSSQRRLASTTEHLRLESGLSSSNNNKEPFHPLGTQSTELTRSELNNLSTLERKSLRNNTVTRCANSQVTRSHESIARVPNDMHNAADTEFEDAADSLLWRRRGLSSSDNRLPTRSNVGSQDAGQSGMSAGSSSSPSSTNLIGQSVDPRQATVQPPTPVSFDPSEEPFQFNQSLSETSYSSSPEFENIQLTSNEIAARMRKLSNKDAASNQSNSTVKGASGNDVLVCCCVIALAVISMATSWWQQEFDFFLIFSLSPVIQNTIFAFAVVFICIGYLVKCFCS